MKNARSKAPKADPNLILDEPEELEREGHIDLVPIYLREMGATPLLDREGEIKLASELDAARTGLVKQLTKLPAAARNARGIRWVSGWWHSPIPPAGSAPAALK